MNAQNHPKNANSTSLLKSREKILSKALNAIKSDSRTPIVFSGPKGTGKSMLLRELAAELDSHALPGFTPLVFPPEAYKVLSVEDFLVTALEIIDKKEASPTLRNAPEAGKGSLERLMETLTRRARELGVVFVFLADDGDELLGAQLNKQNAGRLLELIEGAPELALVIGAEKGLAQAVNSRRLDQMLQFPLKPLSTDECLDLWEMEADSPPLKKDAAFCTILCRGVPGLVAKSARISRFGKGSVEESLQALLETRADYFQSEFSRLPPLERKLFTSLAEFWTPASAKEAAAAAGMDVNKTSSLLSRLASRGMVETARRKGRKKWHCTTAPLTSLHHLLRNGGPQRQNALAFLTFFEAFYGDAPAFAPIAATPVEPQVAASAPLASEPVNSADPAGWTELARTLIKEQAYADAASALKKSLELEPFHPWAWGRLGGLQHERLEQYEEAETSYLKAIEQDQNLSWVWSGLGRLLHEKLKRYIEAEQAYRIAVELEPDSAEPRIHLGMLQEKLERRSTAEKTYLEAAKRDPGHPGPWRALEGLYAQTGQKEQAEQARAMFLKREKAPVKAEKQSGGSPARQTQHQAPPPEPAQYDLETQLRALEGLDKPGPENLVAVINATIDAVAKKGVEYAGEMIKASPGRIWVEPLEAALEMMQDRSPLAPMEVLLTARDVMQEMKIRVDQGRF